MPRNAEPKIPISTGVSPDLFVAAEDFALSNSITRGENEDGSPKANLSGLLTLALANLIGFELPAEEKAAVQEQSAEQKREAARAAEAKRREEARKRVEAIRAKQHREAAKAS